MFEFPILWYHVTLHSRPFVKPHTFHYHIESSWFSLLSDLPNGDGDDTYSYSDMKERDERRFKMADTNYDGVLSFSEYIDFLHPEDAEHMRDIVVMETMEDIDKDKDGVISEAEYIGEGLL